MRLQGLRARPRRRRLPKDSDDRQLETVPANLLDRQFAAERPNQKWIADFTCGELYEPKRKVSVVRR